MDHKIPLIVQADNAIILAYARLGTRTYVNEAFQLARQMLDSHRDARGISAFRLNRKTFCALLEGTKRIRDLGQVRWIMAEMMRGRKEGADPNEVDTETDEELMMHIFNMYAAYTLRTSSLVVPNQSKTTDTSDTSKVTTEVTAGVAIEGPQADSSSSLAPSLVLEGENQNPAFSHILPQSHTDVIQELRILSNRILRDRSDVDALLQPPYPSLTKSSGAWS